MDCIASTEEKKQEPEFRILTGYMLKAMTFAGNDKLDVRPLELINADKLNEAAWIRLFREDVLQFLKDVAIHALHQHVEINIWRHGTLIAVSTRSRRATHLVVALIRYFIYTQTKEVLELFVASTQFGINDDYEDKDKDQGGRGGKGHRHHPAVGLV